MTATPMVGATFFGLDISQFTTRLLSLRRRISKRVLLLEFGPDSLLLAEAMLTHLGVKLSHVSAFALPPEALDRGVPAEPLTMAGLIQDFCSEKKIPAHRVAVVLPPELAFQRLLDLPATLTTEEAREYVLNPANGLQIPFPLTQTDFDLFPVLTPTDVQQVGGNRLYMLTAIPEVLVDPIVEMLQAADLELQMLELGSHSQLRNHAAELITLAPQQVDFVLELLPDVSNLMQVTCSGLLGSERLAGLRNLPELDLDREQQDAALASGFSAEDLVFNDKNYLPLSELDLRVLVADLNVSFERFHLKLPGAQIRRLILTGVNSSHPLLADLLTELLGLPVVLSKSITATGLSDLSMDDLLVRSGLGRLTGLALGLLPNEQLLSCSLEGHHLVSQDSSNANDGVVIADLMSASAAQKSLDLVAAEVIPDASSNNEQKDHDEIIVLDSGSEASASLEPPVPSDAELSTKVADLPDLLIDSRASSTQAEESPSSSINPASLGEASLEVPFEPILSDSLSDHDGLSRSLMDAESLSDDQRVDDSDLSEEQWPSIKSSAPVIADQGSSSSVSNSLDESLTNGTSRSNPISTGMGDSLPETEWPSISFDDDQFINETTVALSDSGHSVSSAQQHMEQSKFDQMQSLSPRDQPHEIEQSSAEDFDSATPLEESTLEQEEEFVISDLDLSEELVQSKQLSTDQVDARNDAGTDEFLTDLGELRFAKDD